MKWTWALHERCMLTIPKCKKYKIKEKKKKEEARWGFTSSS